jgi:hypothetical protein
MFMHMHEFLQYMYFLIASSSPFAGIQDPVMHISSNTGNSKPGNGDNSSSGRVLA